MKLFNQIRIPVGKSIKQNIIVEYLLLEVSRSVLFKGGGQGDGRDHGHAGPLLRLLTHVQGLGGEMLIVLSKRHDTASVCMSCMCAKWSEAKIQLDWRAGGLSPAASVDVVTINAGGVSVCEYTSHKCLEFIRHL